MNEKLYFGGSILTMEDDMPTAEALLIKDGHIAAVGPLAEVEAAASPSVEKVNLEGHTLLPSFIDPHSHFTTFATTLALAQLGGCESFDEMVERLTAYKDARQLPPGAMIIGHGYDHNDLVEKAHPTAEVLDRVSLQHPVLISHVSGHMGAVNSVVLKGLGFSADTPDPEGGVIGRNADGSPNGYLEENAFILLTSQAPQASLENRLALLDRAQDIYLSYGITTVQDGMTNTGEMQLLDAAARAGRLQVDAVGFANLAGAPNLYDDYPQYSADYNNRLRLGGYKIFLDGSPQGHTAWLSQPYENAGEGYCGYPIYTDEQVEAFSAKAIADGRQILAHCNGDAASEQFVESFKAALDKAEAPKDVRPVMVHAQTVRYDQLDRMVPLHMIASFYVAHTYFWGDVHRVNLGDERAMRISPVGTAIKKGVAYTFHQDTPVLPPDMLRTVWCAVNRTTKKGVSLGDWECITPWEALKGVTIHAAYQYFEEDKKGSLLPGKLADLVILDQSPLAVPKEELCDIKVLETIKEGKSLYKAER